MTKLTKYTVRDVYLEYKVRAADEGFKVEKHIFDFFNNSFTFQEESDSDAVQFIDMLQNAHENDYAEFCLKNNIEREHLEAPSYRNCLYKTYNGWYMSVPKLDWE